MRASNGCSSRVEATLCETPRSVESSCVRSVTRCSSEAYASTRNLTQTAAVVELLARGVEAAEEADAAVAATARAAELERELAEARTARQAEALKRQQAEQQHQFFQRAAQTWTTRANQQVGHCPNEKCKSPISGYDLFVSGQCSACERPLTSMLAPEKPGLDQKELLVLFGAVGLLLGVVALSKGNG